MFLKKSSALNIQMNVNAFPQLKFFDTPCDTCKLALPFKTPKIAFLIFSLNSKLAMLENFKTSQNFNLFTTNVSYQLGVSMYHVSCM